MAKLHFFYGVMGAAKSAELCINAYKLRKAGKKYEVLKPAVDNRDSLTEVVSRIGLREPAMALVNLDSYMPKKDTKFVLIDEVQFFSVSDIHKIVNIADTSNITIFCYGLTVDSNGNMFPASAALFAANPESHEYEVVCEMPECDNHASHHLRFDQNGNIIRGGKQVEVGDSQYLSVCRPCFHKYYDNPSENLLWYLYKKRSQNTK